MGGGVTRRFEQCGWDIIMGWEGRSWMVNFISLSRCVASVAKDDAD
jgi:hypothetical protein